MATRRRASGAPTGVGIGVAIAVVVALCGSPASALAPSAGPAAAAGAAWRWPIPPPHTVLRPFRAPLTAYGSGHRGIDLPAEPGTVVLAPAAGIVFFAGTVVDRPVLSIQHHDGLLSSVEPVESPLAEGAAVRAGDPIGVVVATEHCPEQNCLHLGVRRNGRYLSPLLMLGGIPRSILLPLDPADAPGAR